MIRKSQMTVSVAQNTLLSELDCCQNEDYGWKESDAQHGLRPLLVSAKLGNGDGSQNAEVSQ